MHPTAFESSWDSLMFGIPLIALLIFGYFRVDEIFGPKKRVHAAPHPTRPVADPCDPSLLTDPDGTPWN